MNAHPTGRMGRGDYPRFPFVAIAALTRATNAASCTASLSEMLMARRLPPSKAGVRKTNACTPMRELRGMRDSRTAVDSGLRPCISRALRGHSRKSWCWWTPQGEACRAEAFSKAGHKDNALCNITKEISRDETHRCQAQDRPPDG